MKSREYLFSAVVVYERSELKYEKKVWEETYVSVGFLDSQLGTRGVWIFRNDGVTWALVFWDSKWPQATNCKQPPDGFAPSKSTQSKNEVFLNTREATGVEARTSDGRSSSLESSFEEELGVVVSWVKDWRRHWGLQYSLSRP